MAQSAQGIALYVHIPFCRRKCAYCDFPSYAGQEALIFDYVEALCEEIDAQGSAYEHPRVRSIYLGGGTPSLLDAGQMERIMASILDAFQVDARAEISLEANPGTVDYVKLCAFRTMGFNRISLGIQSLDDALLRRIGRIHSAAQAVEAVELARRAGFDNLNLDLMYGLPGQSVEQWGKTLRDALALEPSHLSCYELIVEEGTPLCAAVRSGEGEALPDEETLARMDEETTALLVSNGFERYEVSNYAKPGKACVHNLAYWECLPYLGVGCAAHSDMGVRFYNDASLTRYLSRDSSARHLPEGENTPASRIFERAMMGLRMTQGMDNDRFRQDFHRTPEEVWPEQMERLTRGGLMEHSGSRLRLTPRGMQVMNGILTELLP